MARLLTKRLTAALLLAVLVVPCGGWSNGPNGGNGFGTHDWVLYQANRLATAKGYSWLDWPVAQPVTDDPDTVLHDTYHHVYDVWGSSYGDAPVRVQQLYDETVAELKRGDRTAASKSFGLLSHYYADICNPLHTDQCPEEERMHSSYELAAQTYTNAPNEDAAWVVSDGIVRVGNVASKTRNAATFAHESYRALVDGYLSGGMSPKVLAITRTSVVRAANDLADLIASAAADARLSSALPSPSSAATSMADVPGISTASPQAEATTGTAPNTLGTGVLPSARTSGETTEATGPASPAPTNVPPTLLLLTVAGAVFAAALYGAMNSGPRHRN